MYKCLWLVACLFATSFTWATNRTVERINRLIVSNQIENVRVLRINLEKNSDINSDFMVIFQICRIKYLNQSANLPSWSVDLSSCWVDPELEELKISYGQIKFDDIEEFHESDLSTFGWEKISSKSLRLSCAFLSASNSSNVG